MDIYKEEFFCFINLLGLVIKESLIRLFALVLGIEGRIGFGLYRIHESFSGFRDLMVMDMKFINKLFLGGF